jgi:Fic family protein
MLVGQLRLLLRLTSIKDIFSLLVCINLKIPLPISYHFWVFMGIFLGIQLFTQGRLTISDMVVLTNANRNTIKKHLETLVDNKQLVKHGTGKGTWYTVN